MEVTREFIEANRGKRFNVVFDDGSKLNKIGFFVSSNGVICYMTSRQKRRGYVFPIYNNIKSIDEVIIKQPTIKGNAKTLFNRTHKNAWSELRKEWEGISNGDEITQDFKWHFCGKLNFRNISSEMSPTQRAMLKDAFETNSSYKWNRRANAPQGRDLSIEARLCDDGVFRAWFSSEFPGCLNGDYYLLINPTTAIYYERD